MLRKSYAEHYDSGELVLSEEMLDDRGVGVVLPELSHDHCA